MQTTDRGYKKLEGGDYVPAAFYDADSAFNANVDTLESALDDVATVIDDIYDELGNKLNTADIGSQTVAYAGGASGPRFALGGPGVTTRGAIESDQAQRLYLYASNESIYLFWGVGSDNAWHFMPIGGSAAFNPSLGTSARKWGDIWSTNGTIQTSDGNEKKDIVSLDVKYCKELIMALKPCSFKFIEGTSGRTHFGMVAQDVEEALAEKGIDTVNFAPFIKDVKTEVVEVKQEDGSTMKKERALKGQYVYGLRYEEFIAPMIRLLQAQQGEIDTLKSELLALKGEK